MIRNEYIDLIKRGDVLVPEIVQSFEDILRTQTTFRPQGCAIKWTPHEIKEIPRGVKHIEILHSGDFIKGKYACAYYDGDEIHLYDATKPLVNVNYKIHSEYESVIKQMFPRHDFKLLPIRIPVVDRQVSDKDEAVFAIAIATSLALDATSRDQLIYFNRSQMREKLISILSRGVLEEFPIFCKIPRVPHKDLAYDVIRRGDLLGDENIFMFEEILRSHTNFEPRGCLMKQLPHLIVPISKGQKHLEILHTGDKFQGHYVLFYYNGVRPIIYDSINNKKVEKDAETFIKLLMPWNNFATNPIMTVDVDRQQNGTDCGVLSISLACSTALDPSSEHVKILFDHEKTRDFLIQMISQNKLEEFPILRKIPRNNFNAVSNSTRASAVKKSNVVLSHHLINPLVRPIPRASQIASTSASKSNIQAVGTNAKAISTISKVHNGDLAVQRGSSVTNTPFSAAQNDNCLVKEQIVAFLNMLKDSTNYKPRFCIDRKLDEIEPVEEHKKHIEILPRDDCNYDCIYSDTQRIYVYNSLSEKSLTSLQQACLERLFPKYNFVHKPLIFPNIDRATSKADTGLVAVAIATSLAFGVRPDQPKIYFNHLEIRKHFVNLLKDKVLRPFPQHPDSPIYPYNQSLQVINQKDKKAEFKRLSRERTKLQGTKNVTLNSKDSSSNSTTDSNVDKQSFTDTASNGFENSNFLISNSQQFIHPSLSNSIDCDNNSQKQANLTNSDKSILTSYDKYSAEEYVTKFQQILRTKTIYNPRGFNLKWSNEVIEPVPKYKEHVEFMFDGDRENSVGHWSVLYYNAKSLYVYESASDNLSESTYNLYTSRLFPYLTKDQIIPIFSQVDRHENPDDSVLYAIAFAISLAFGLHEDIAKIQFDGDQMKTHLLKLLNEMTIEHFPQCPKSKNLIEIPSLDLANSKKISAEKVRLCRLRKKNFSDNCSSSTNDTNDSLPSKRLKSVDSSHRQIDAENKNSEDNSCNTTPLVNKKRKPTDDLVSTNNKRVQHFPTDLTDYEIKLIRTGAWLSDNHVVKFRNLLRIFTNYSMQDTVLADNPNRIREVPADTKHIQILHNRARLHWICSFYNTENIAIYDSMYKDDSIEDYIDYLYALFPYYFDPKTKEPLRPIVFPLVDQQGNGSDCAVFSIAFAVHLAYGIDLEGVKFDHPRMREHLANMFRLQKIETFPTIEENGPEISQEQSDGAESYVFIHNSMCGSDKQDAASFTSDGNPIIEDEKKPKTKAKKQTESNNLKLKSNQEQIIKNVASVLPEGDEVDKRVAAEKIVRLCYYKRSKVIAAMHKQLQRLSAAAAHFLDNESKMDKNDFDGRKSALCGTSEHTSCSEAYFSSTTYKQLKSLKILEFDGQGQTKNVLHPKGMGKKHVKWICNDEMCNITENDLLLYKYFLQSLVKCTLSTFLDFIRKFPCTATCSKFKKGHTEHCMANPQICDSRFVILHKLCPHFPDVRHARSNIYSLMRKNAELSEISIALEEPRIDVLQTIADKLEAEGVSLRKKRQTPDIVDETKLQEQYGKSIKAFTKRSMETPIHQCMSCNKLCYKKDVRFVCDPDLITGPVWQTFKDYLQDKQRRECNNDEHCSDEDVDSSLTMKELIICRYCFEKIRKDLIPPTSVLNNMDPGEVPEVLKALKAFDKYLIQRAKPFQTVVRMDTVKGKGKGSRQKEKNQKVKGKTFHLPIPLQPTLNKICPTNMAINEFSGLRILVNSIPSNTNLTYQDLCDVTQILTVLQWFQLYNKHYYDIELPTNCRDLLKDFPLDIEEINDSQTSNDNRIEAQSKEGFLTQIKDMIEYNEKFTVYPLHSKTVTDEPIDLYQMKKIQEAPIDSRHKDLDTMCFPWLYPYGDRGQHEERIVPITEFEYAKARLLSGDPRFRRDIQYLFFLLNQQTMRALSSGIYYCLNVIDQRFKVTAGDLKNSTLTKEFNDNFNAVLRDVKGTQQYFSRARNDLKCMFRCYGPATWFYTISPGEWLWEDLLEYLREVNKDDPKFATMGIKEMIPLDPVSVSRFVENKFRATLDFLTSADEPMGKVVHYFWRREYQNRGLQHFHLLLWCAGAPKIGVDSEEAVMDYILQHVTCKMPDHTSKTLFTAVNTYQMHKHNDYCMRSIKTKSGKFIKSCRFQFPRPVTDSIVIKDISKSIAGRRHLKNSSRLVDLPREEHERYINDYNPPTLLVWQGNNDVQFIHEKSEALGLYCAKYACKAEISHVGEEFKDVKDTGTAFKKLFKLGAMAIDHREVGSLEAADYTLGHASYGTDKDTTFRWVNINEYQNKCVKRRQQILNLPDDSTDIFYKNIVDDYYPYRPERLEDLSLYDFCANYDVKDQPPVYEENRTFFQVGDKYYWYRTRPYLISHYDYHPAREPEKYFFSLLLLFQPWRDKSELKNGCDTYTESFKKVQDFLQSASDYHNKQLTLQKAREDLEKLIEEEMARLENQDDANTPENAMDFEAIGAEIAADEYKDLNNNKTTDVPLDALVAQLNVEQREVFDHVTSVVRESIENPKAIVPEDLEVLRHYVSGEGGTGKSFVIEAISRHVREVLGKQVAIAAPTGVAAKNVNGTTLHRLLQLPVERDGAPKYKPLSNRVAKIIRDKLQDTVLYILDEVSMISNLTLIFIHLRLKQLFGDVWFGGKHLLVFGDLLQLPPVRADPVFKSLDRATVKKCLQSLGATNLWQELFTYDELTINMRQKDDATYAAILQRARAGFLTNEDVHTLESKLIPIDDSKGTEEMLKELCDYLEKQPANTVCLLPTNAMCAAVNEAMLQRLNGEEVELVAQDSLDCHPRLNNTVLKNLKKLDGDSSKTGGIDRVIKVKIGCRLMIRRNIDVSLGIVNGTMVTLNSFVREPNGDISGLRVMLEDGKEVVIERATVNFEVCSNGFVNRKQFPVSLSYAITIHKSQGLSLDSALMDIGQSSFQPGQAYVALSRLRSLLGLHLINFDPRSVRASDDAINEYNRLKKKFKPGAALIDSDPEDKTTAGRNDRVWGCYGKKFADTNVQIPAGENLVSPKKFKAMNEESCINAILQCIMNIPSSLRHLLCVPDKDSLTSLADLYKSQNGPFDASPLVETLKQIVPDIDLANSSQVFETLCLLTSGINTIVEFKLTCSVRCKVCEYTQSSQDVQNILTVNVEADKSIKLETAINSSFDHWKNETNDLLCQTCKKDTPTITKRNLLQANKILIVKLMFSKKKVSITAASERFIVIQGKKYTVLGAIVCKKAKDDSVKFSAVVRKKKTFFWSTDLETIIRQWPRGCADIELLFLETIS